MPWLSIRRCMPIKMYQRIIRSPFLCLIVLLLTIITVILFGFPLPNNQQECPPEIDMFQQQRQQSINSNSLRENQPVIFVGGMPRSGTTLMRAILDSHPRVHCGEETRVIPRILNLRTAWKRSTSEGNQLASGGINDAMVDSAVRAFIYEILVQHGKSADVLCDKDPFVLKYSSYVASIFPNAKFLLLIRDARAVIHSVVTRDVAITGFNPNDYRQNLELWNKGIEEMVDGCIELGKDKCFMVYYEQLVLQPKKTIKTILNFLNLHWVDSVLHHEELIGKKISLSQTEVSTDQVIKPINLEALTRWVKGFPNDVKKDIDTLAPMLKQLGYDTKSEIPTYGTADQLVLDNMNKLKVNAQFWDAKAKSYALKSSEEISFFQNESINQNVQ